LKSGSLYIQKKIPSDVLAVVMGEVAFLIWQLWKRRLLAVQSKQKQKEREGI
jgi:hypothetical protein